MAINEKKAASTQQETACQILSLSKYNTPAASEQANVIRLNLGEL